MIDTDKVNLILEFSIRGYIFGIGEASPEELKKDLKKILSTSKLALDFVDKQFDEILEKKLKEMDWNK